MARLFNGIITLPFAVFTLGWILFAPIAAVSDGAPTVEAPPVPTPIVVETPVAESSLEVLDDEDLVEARERGEDLARQGDSILRKVELLEDLEERIQYERYREQLPFKVTKQKKEK